jgi:hypothetical protein
LAFFEDRQAFIEESQYSSKTANIQSVASFVAAFGNSQNQPPVILLEQHDLLLCVAMTCAV